MPRHTTAFTTPVPQNRSHWKAPVRMMHWGIATSLAGAAILTTQGDIGHATLGWLALGAVLAGQIILGRHTSTSPALWLVAAVLAVLNLSGSLAPYGSFHLGTTLAALVLAALYAATVLFEFMQCVTCRRLFAARVAPFGTAARPR